MIAKSKIDFSFSKFYIENGGSIPNLVTSSRSCQENKRELRTEQNWSIILCWSFLNSLEFQNA